MCCHYLAICVIFSGLVSPPPRPPPPFKEFLNRKRERGRERDREREFLLIEKFVRDGTACPCYESPANEEGNIVKQGLSTPIILELKFTQGVEKKCLPVAFRSGKRVQ